MATLADLLIKVDVDRSGVGSGISGITSDLDRLDNEGRSKMAGFLGGIGRTAAAGIAVVGTAAVAVGGFAVKAAIEARTVAGQTEAALESTGGAANITASEIANLAKSIRDYSGISDEAIQSAENILLTFTQVRNEVGKGNDIFSQAVPLIADMSVRMGTDLNSAALQVGKALNDPIRGMTALSRAGVQFTDQQREQITAMVEAGDVMGAQKIILRELAVEFGGSAKALGDAQPWNILKETVGDSMESVGESILSVGQQVLPALAPAFAGIIEAIGPLAAGIAGALGEILTGIGPALAQVFEILAPVLTDVVMAFGDMLIALAPLLPPLAELLAAVAPLIVLFAQVASTVLSVVVPAIAAIIGVIADVVGAVVGFVTSWSDAWTAIKDFFVQVWDTIKQLFSDFWPVLLGIATGGISLIVTLFIDNWGKIKDFLVGIWDAIKNVVSTAFNAVKNTVSTVLNAIKGVWNTVWGAIKEFASTVWNGIKNAVTTAFNAVKDFIGDKIRAIQDTWRNVWGAVKDFFAGIWNGIVSIAKSAVNALIGIINGVIGAINAVAEAIANVATFGMANVPDIPSIPTIGGSQRGGHVTRGGLRWVGEAGPELADLPPGATVIPHAESMGMAGGLAGLSIVGSLQLTEDGLALLRGVVAEEIEDGRLVTDALTRVAGGRAS